MKEKNWSYLAGLFDGDGSVFPHTYCVDKEHGYYAHQVKENIVGCDLRLMRWLVQHFGGKFYPRTKRTSAGNLVYYWMPTGKKNRETFLLGILPYLVSKQEQALLALEFERLQGICPDKRIAIQKKIYALNHKESAETNTLDTKIESELIGNDESAPQVTAGA